MDDDILLTFTVFLTRDTMTQWMQATKMPTAIFL